MTADTALVVAFDVNETLSDMQGLAPRLEELGAPPGLIELWFAQTLRDGFALTAAGAYADFSSVATSCLITLLEPVPDLKKPPEAAAQHVIEALGELALHSDVVASIQRLADRGSRVVTLGNGAARIAEAMLERAGIRHLVEQCLSVADAGRWKPHPAAYRYAAEQCKAQPEDLMLVATHPWDIDGASRAGLRTGWVSRGTGAYPPYFRQPDIRGRDLTQLVSALEAGQQR